MADERLEAQPEKPLPPPVRLMPHVFPTVGVPRQREASTGAPPGLPLRLRRPGGRGSVRGSPCDEPARLRTGLQGSIPSPPGIRGPLHPPRHRSPPSPYRHGYASVGRLAGGGASTLSVLGLCGNGTLESGLTLPPVFPTAGVPQGAYFVRKWGMRLPCFLPDTLPYL